MLRAVWLLICSLVLEDFVIETLVAVVALFIWRVVAAVMPYMPATIWALRAPRDSPHYLCPPLPRGRPPCQGFSAARATDVGADGVDAVSVSK